MKSVLLRCPAVVAGACALAAASFLALAPPSAAQAPSPPDSTAASPAPAPAVLDTIPTAPPAVAPADTTAPAPAATPPADTTTIKPVPLPAPVPTETPVRAGKNRRARPAATPRPAGAAVDPWARGSNWFSVRAGYARSAENNAAPGNFGVGAGVRRMFLSGWSAALQYDWNQLGRFGQAKEIEAPITMELDHHFAWKTAARPYLGIGTGFYYHQYRGTGRDLRRMLFGAHLDGGIDVPVGGRHLLGMDLRYENINNQQEPPNPIFGGERVVFVHVTAKLSYSYVF